MKPVFQKKYLAAAAVAIILAGCQSSGGGSSGGATPGTTLSLLRIGFPSTTATLDPALSSIPINTFIFPLYDRLLTPDSTGTKVLPMLATSWAFSADGKSLTLKLRQDAFFHDGTQITADVVKQNIVRDQTLPQSTAASHLTSISSIDVVNSSTVQINLSGGGADLPSTLSGVYGSIVNPKTFSADLSHNPPAAAGSGPWVLSSSPTFPSDFYYTRAGGPPNWDKNAGAIKNLEIHFVSPANAVNGVRAGQLDIALVTADGIPTARSFQDQGMFTGYYTTVTAVLELMMNPAKPPFDNPLVRQAVAAGIDRNAISNDLFKANCQATDQPVRTTDWSYDKSFKNPYTYDPAKAKSLLAQAGFPNGFSTTLTYPALSIFPSVTQVYQSQLAAIGINATLEGLDAGSAIPRALQHDYTMFSFVNAAGGDPNLAYDWDFGSFLSIGKGTPEGAQMATLAKQALDPTLSQDKRAALYGQIWSTAVTQAWSIPICAQGELWIFNHVSNVDPSHVPWLFAGHMDPRYLT